MEVVTKMMYRYAYPVLIIIEILIQIVIVLKGIMIMIKETLNALNVSILAKTVFLKHNA